MAVKGANKNKKKAMLQALEKSLGIVSTAAKIADVSRMSHHKWVKIDEEYAAAVRDIEDLALDFAESKLHTLVSKENVAAVIFFLKTKGKRRGYIEKQEIDYTAIPKIEIVDDTKMKNDLLD